MALVTPERALALKEEFLAAIKNAPEALANLGEVPMRALADLGEVPLRNATKALADLGEVPLRALTNLGEVPLRNATKALADLGEVPLRNATKALADLGEVPLRALTNLGEVPLRNAAPVGDVLTGAALSPVAVGGAALLASAGQLGGGEDEALRQMKLDQQEQADKTPLLGVGLPKPNGNSGFFDKAFGEGAMMDAINSPNRNIDLSKPIPFAISRTIPVNDSESKALALFKTTYGSSFDPKSSMNKKKMAAITSLMDEPESESLTPNQFAMKIYRTTK